VRARFSRAVCIYYRHLASREARQCVLGKGAEVVIAQGLSFEICQLRGRGVVAVPYALLELLNPVLVQVFGVLRSSPALLLLGPWVRSTPATFVERICQNGIRKPVAALLAPRVNVQDYWNVLLVRRELAQLARSED